MRSSGRSPVRPARDADPERTGGLHRRDLLDHRPRKKKVAFAGPYLDTGQSLLVRADNTDITGPESLANGKKLCSVSGSTPAQRIKDKYPGVQLQQYDTYSVLRRGAAQRCHRRRQHRRGDPGRFRRPVPGALRSSASRSPSSTTESACAARTSSCAPRSTRRSSRCSATAAGKRPSTAISDRHHRSASPPLDTDTTGAASENVDIPASTAA